MGVPNEKIYDVQGQGTGVSSVHNESQLLPRGEACSHKGTRLGGTHLRPSTNQLGSGVRLRGRTPIWLRKSSGHCTSCLTCLSLGFLIHKVGGLYLPCGALLRMKDTNSYYKEDSTVASVSPSLSRKLAPRPG